MNINFVKSIRDCIMILLSLLIVGGSGAAMAQQNADAPSADTIYVSGTRIPAAIGAPGEEAGILTPKPGPKPHINGPRTYGCRPGQPGPYGTCGGKKT